MRILGLSASDGSELGALSAHPHPASDFLWKGLGVFPAYRSLHKYFLCKMHTIECSVLSGRSLDRLPLRNGGLRRNSGGQRRANAGDGVCLLGSAEGTARWCVLGNSHS